MPGANPPPLLPLVVVLAAPAPHPTAPKTRHSASNISTSQKPRRLLMSSIPIMENGSNARKIDRPLTCDFAVTPLPPVVLTESVAVFVVVPSMTSGFGEIEQLDPFGPEHVKLIDPLKPFSGATEKV